MLYICPLIFQWVMHHYHYRPLWSLQINPYFWGDLERNLLGKPKTKGVPRKQIRPWNTSMAPASHPTTRTSDLNPSDHTQSGISTSCWPVVVVVFVAAWLCEGAAEGRDVALGARNIPRTWTFRVLNKFQGLNTSYGKYFVFWGNL